MGQEENPCRSRPFGVRTTKASNNDPCGRLETPFDGVFSSSMQDKTHWQKGLRGCIKVR
jgi:hypothetical protein